ncbi:MAG: hypothetical protein J2P48_02805 [Alphaproteobacteria bacterium]|nr:hypothetical protein [Alphaproteobacteria bacterium]
MIVLSSTIGAIVITTALALPELLNNPHAETGTILLTHLPALAVAALAVYALCAMLLTTAALVAGMLRMRQHLGHAVSGRTLAQRDWLAALGANGFRQLIPRLTPTLAQSARADGGVVLQTRLLPNETRGEIARLHYISLARSHFFSTLIVMAGIVGLGLAQDRGSLPFASGAIPTTSTILILIGLILLAALSRIAIDVTAEPLLESIAQLPAEHVEVGLLRRAVELLEVARSAPEYDNEGVPSTPAQLPEELVAVIERGYHDLSNAVARLTTHTEALETVMRSSAEAISATLNRSTPSPATDAYTELHAAVGELTAVLRSLTASPDGEEGPLPAEALSRQKAASPGLAHELRRLLQEI